jgi:hypothetical protein
MLDFVKQICGPRPRCVASVPKAQRLLTQAREKGVYVVYSVAGQTVADILPEWLHAPTNRRFHLDQTNI